MHADATGWDGEQVLLERDPASGATFAIAIHSTTLGPAVGGTRWRAYASADDALADARRLAAAMTLKFAVPGLPWGGGKGVIAAPELRGHERVALLRRYGEVVAGLQGRYRTAPDAGTGPADMDVIAETAGPWVFGRTPGAGGAGSSGPATAAGVLAAMQAACSHAFGSAGLSGARVLVEGAGSVGGALVRLLAAEGAEVLVAEIDHEARAAARHAGATPVVPGEVAGIDCDVYAPCAFGGVLNAATVPRLRCRVVAGGANNQLADDVPAAALAARGILYVPDFVANAGGAMAGVRMEADGWPRERAEAEVREKIADAVARLLELGRTRGLDPDTAARALARERLAAGPAA